MRLGIEVGEDRRDRAAHRAGDLDHSHGGPELGRRRRDFEPDEARADDDDLEACSDPLAERGRIGNVAEGEDARKVDAGDVEAPLARAGRQDQMAVADRGAAGDFDLARPRSIRAAPHAEPQLDPLVAKEGFGPQRQAVQVHLALEKGLRQRRALIGQLLLVGKQDDRAVISLFAQAGGGLHAGVAGADDDDRGRAIKLSQFTPRALNRRHRPGSAAGRSASPGPGSSGAMLSGSTTTPLRATTSPRPKPTRCG